MGIIRILADKVQLPANAKDQTIVSLQPEKGKRYKVLECLLLADAAAKFKIFINNVRIGEAHSEALAKDPRRILVNWELSENDVLYIYADELSGSSNNVYYVLVYEESS